MPVNDFEKQVQQKMDELQLRPSTEVWEEVEKRIRKEKKRRWFILWFFLLGAVLLGGTGWWLVTNNKQQTIASTTTAEMMTDKKSISEPVTKKNDIKVNTITDKKDNDEPKAQKEKLTISAINNSTTSKTKIVANKEKLIKAKLNVVSKKNKRVSNTVMIPSKKKNKEIDEPVATVVNIDNQLEKTLKKNNDDVATVNQKNNSTTVNINVKDNDSVITDKSIAAAASEDDKLPTSTVPKLDSLITKPDKTIVKLDSNKIKKNKWEIGVTGMAGISAKSDGISIFGMEKSFDAANLSNINNPGTGGQFAVAPGPPGNGFAWQLGAYGKRKLSARTSVSIGLGFSFYSSTQATGAYVDSSRVYNNNLYAFYTRDFYRSGNGRIYTNHYYYLQLPFAFHWQVNKGKKVPIVFQNGFSTGYFIGSDALVYNAGANVFYTDNKSFNKLQLSYQSGVYAKLFNRSKNPLTAGFLFNYHLSKQQKVNIYGGNHLTSFGIQLGWILKK